jgi:hypothetical protein
MQGCQLLETNDIISVGLEENRNSISLKGKDDWLLSCLTTQRKSSVKF